MNLDWLFQLFKIAPDTKVIEDLDLDYCNKNSIDYEARKNDFYVNPTLEVIQETPGNSQIVLLSAPAAVGKTSLAREIQFALKNHDRQVLYVPLQKSSIGDNFFSGLLTNLYPTKSKKEIIEAINTGRLILIFDGYDEVSLSNGQADRNIAFMNEVFKEFEGSLRIHSNSPSMIFLFRSVFYQMGVFDPIEPISIHIKIDFFNQDQRKKYLTNYLEYKSPEKRNVSALANEFLTAFETQMKTNNESTNAFFGHAIVLSAFGDYLLESEKENALTLLNDLSSNVVSGSFSESILNGIIHTILNRETTKFPDIDFKNYIPSFNGYSIELQEELLKCIAIYSGDQVKLREELNKKISDQARTNLTNSSEYNALSKEQKEELLRKYQEELSARINHHPFLDLETKSRRLVFRNPIYNEFYFAKSISLQQIEISKVVELLPQASHFLAIFLLSFLDKRDISNLPKDSIYYLVSLLSLSTSQESFSFEMKWEKDKWVGTFKSPTLEIDSIIVSDPVLDLLLPNDAVMRNVDISAIQSDGSLVNNIMLLITGNPGHTINESNFKLINTNLNVDTVELDVCKVDFDGTYINCNELGFTDRHLEIVNCDQLSIAPNKVFNIRWSEYSKNRWESSIKDQVVTVGTDYDDILSLLSAVLLWFRKHGRDDFAVYEKRFNTVVLAKGNNDIIEKFVNLLRAIELIYSEGALVKLNQSKLKEFGLYYVKQNKIECGDRSLLRPLQEEWKKILVSV